MKKFISEIVKDVEDKIEQEKEIKELLIKIAKIMIKNKSLGLDVEFETSEHFNFIIKVDIEEKGDDNNA